MGRPIGPGSSANPALSSRSYLFAEIPMDLTADEVEQLKGLLAKQPRKPRKKDTPRYLSEEQVDRFFSVIRDARDIAIFRVMYHRGLRASEVGKIQFSDWNRNQDRLRFTRLKGSNGGEYHLTAREVKALRSWLRIRG